MPVPSPATDIVGPHDAGAPNPKGPEKKNETPAAVSLESSTAMGILAPNGELLSKPASRSSQSTVPASRSSETRREISGPVSAVETMPYVNACPSRNHAHARRWPRRRPRAKSSSSIQRTRPLPGVVHAHRPVSRDEVRAVLQCVAGYEERVPSDVELPGPHRQSPGAGQRDCSGPPRPRGRGQDSTSHEPVQCRRSRRRRHGRCPLRRG